MEEKNKKLVSVIVPIYNTKKEFIQECLDSIADQTLDKRDYEIIIVDDCSNKPEIVRFIEELNSKKDFKGVDLKVIRHQKNRWVAQARITGFKCSGGKYLVFLDGDDMIKKDYLKKAALLLETSPNAGWVYPNTRKFGYFYRSHPAIKFNASKLFFNNYCVYASLFRRSAWSQVLQREKFVIKGVRFYEDWDTFIRLMVKGWYGLPLSDSEFLYRQHYRSQISRSPKLHALSTYVTWRSNFFSFFNLFKSQYNYRKDFRLGFRGKGGVLNPYRYFNFFVSSAVKKFTGGMYAPGFFTFDLFLYSLFKPQRFIEKFLNPNYTFTLAEYFCDFLKKPEIDFKKTIVENFKTGKNVIFAHPWWLIGGAESVLLNWMVSTKKIKDAKIIDLVKTSLKEYGELREDFSRYSDEQYALDKIAGIPLRKLKFCWNLIVKERPDVLFISSSPFFYALLPVIKREFPDIKVIDILHSDEPRMPVSWFSISDEYKKYIDKRIVISEIWRDVLIEKYREKKEKIYVFKNFIDLKRFDPERYNKLRLCKDFSVNPEKFVVGFINRLHTDKNPFVFVELARLMKDSPEFEFIMVGDGPLKAKVKKRAELLSNLRFFGSTSDVSRYIAMCDLLVCPSRSEGYPLIGLEAAAMNVPIIATDIIGFREQINLGGFGMLYQQKNIISDSKEIKHLILENKNNFSKIGKNGRKFVLKHHDPKKLSEEYKKFMEELLSS